MGCTGWGNKLRRQKKSAWSLGGRVQRFAPGRSRKWVSAPEKARAAWAFSPFSIRGLHWLVVARAEGHEPSQPLQSHTRPCCFSGLKLIQNWCLIFYIYHLGREGEISIGYLFHTPHTPIGDRTNLKPGHVPQLGAELSTLWCSWRSTSWATPARTKAALLLKNTLEEITHKIS